MIPVKQKRGYTRQILVALGIAFISLSSVAQSGRVDLPELGNSASNVISAAEEKKYAQNLVRQLRAYELLVEDALIHDFFSNMGYRLASNSDQPEAAFNFVVLDQPVINAFAAPGGVIALHSGLILLAETQDEVAGVLSHEIAHITQLHMYRAFEKAKTMNIITTLAMLGLILASGGDGQVVTGAVVGAQGVAAQARINFTRHNEVEADRVGIRTLSAAGYNPQGMADFFEKMAQTTRANGEGPPEFLRTHPVSVNRIAEAKSRIENLPEAKTSDGSQFFIVQARLRALLENDPTKAAKYFETELAKPTSEARKNGLRYGLAIAKQRNAEFDEAQEALSQLMEAEPNRLAYQLQMANLDLKRGRDEQAISSLADLYMVFPGNKAIAIEYATALLNRKDPENAAIALDVLKRQLVKRKDNPALYELYARAASIAGDEIRSTEAIAESYYQRGGTEEAITQLESLERRSDLDYYQRARVTARLMELRIEQGDIEQPPKEKS